MASASIRPPKPESMPARFNYPSLPGNPDSTQPKSALSAFGTVIGGDCAADGTVTLAEDDNKICTITNYDNFGGCPTTCCEPGDGTEDCVPPHCSSACLRCSPPGGQCP